MTPLMEPFDKEFVGSNVKEIEYDGKNMNAPQTLLDYLDHSLNQVAQLFINDFTEILSKINFRWEATKLMEVFVIACRQF